MKKGFTLIEMMAVVVILGVIALIVVPLVEQALSNIKDDAYNTQIESIRQGARQWGGSNIYSMPDPGTSITLTLQQLKLAGFITKDLYNPKTKEAFSDDMVITITNVGTVGNDKYVYIVDGADGGQTNPNAPTIVLVGDSLQYLNLNASYVESGVVAKNGAGTVISANPAVITRNGTTVGSIDSSGLYTYIITYSVTDNGFTTRAIRNVIIKDNVPPTLIIPVDSSILNTVTTFNLMSGVSATDNSLKTVTITYTGSLQLGVVGKYIITYKATDQAGNVTTKARTITITY